MVLIASTAVSPAPRNRLIVEIDTGLPSHEARITGDVGGEDSGQSAR
jgi:hypothetical protein